MARSSGVGGLIAVLAVLFLAGGSKRKLTGASFTGFNIPSASRTISYTEYLNFMSAPTEDVEADASSELVPFKTGVIRTVNGRIPTPSGGSVPFPSTHIGRVAVDKMLQPLEEAIEEPHFQDVGSRKSVNLRLKPI